MLYSVRGRKLQLLIQFASAMALTLFGWDAGVIGGIVGTPQFLKSISFTGDTGCSPVGMATAFYILPRFGRKPMLIIGGAGQLTMMVLFTILSNLGSKITPTTNWIAVATLFVYQLINGATWIWLPYLYGVEIVPMKYRGQVNSIGNAAFWLVAFIEVYASPIALAGSTGAKIFIWFCVTGACVLAVVVALSKETRGLTLGEIDLLWATDAYKGRHEDIVQAIEEVHENEQMGESEKV